MPHGSLAVSTLGFSERFQLTLELSPLSLNFEKSNEN